MWVLDSLSHEKVYNIYKLICAPAIFWVICVLYGVDLIITYVNFIDWSLAVVYLFLQLISSDTVKFWEPDKKSPSAEEWNGRSNINEKENKNIKIDGTPYKW